MELLLNHDCHCRRQSFLSLHLPETNCSAENLFHIASILNITFDKPPFTQRNFVEYVLPFCSTGNVSAWKLVAMVQW